MKALRGILLAIALTLSAQPVLAQTLNMSGVVSFARIAGAASVSVQTLSNTRPPGTLSGSLVLQIWASSTLYTGGSLRGYKMTQIPIGQLKGGFHLSDVTVDGDFVLPPRGTYYTIVVLAEWNGSAYGSFDWVNFPPTKYAKWIFKNSATATTN